MRLLLVILCIFPSLVWPQASKLDDLYKGHHWFALEAALKATHGPDLYIGAVASAFGRTRQAEASLHAVIRTAPNSQEAYEAHEWLAYLYMREGRYGQAVAEMKQKVNARPDKRSAGEDALIQALATLPDQRLIQHRPSTVPLTMEHNDLVIPLSINGHPAHFIVDSDANLSALSPDQAAALGMKVTRTGARALGATGAGTGFDLAVADHLQIGNSYFRNVAFMVYPDDSELFKRIPLGRRGLLGLPVLRSLGQIQWSPNGPNPTLLSLGQTNPHAPGSPNICFDGSDPVTELQYKGHSLDVLLDTGNEETTLWPPFARSFLPPTTPAAKHTNQVSGFDGVSHPDSVTIPHMDLELGGKIFHLTKLQALLNETTLDSQWYFGRVGVDLLNRATQVTLNFQTLTLALR